MELEAEGKHYAVNGNSLGFRAIDRAKVKFKNRKIEKINHTFLNTFLA